jgi:hypothetical protein
MWKQLFEVSKLLARTSNVLTRVSGFRVYMYDMSFLRTFARLFKYLYEYYKWLLVSTANVPNLRLVILRRCVLG